MIIRGQSPSMPPPPEADPDGSESPGGDSTLDDAPAGATGSDTNSWVSVVLFFCVIGLLVSEAFGGAGEAGWWLSGGVALIVLAVGACLGALFTYVFLRRAGRGRQQ